MTAKILDGEGLARRVLAELRPRVAAVAADRGSPPLLAILSIGGDASSELYMKRKLEACREAGIETSVQALPDSVPENDVFKLLKELDEDPGVDGVIVDTPLPPRLRLARLLEHLPPAKDVEGLTPANFGRFFAAKSLADLEAEGVLTPPTPHAVLRLFLETRVAARGLEAVVVGRSSIVGRPAAHLLSCLDATVTLCHSRTRDLKAHLRRADVVVSAVGRPRFIAGEDLKNGSVVLDAGIAYEGKKIFGDVDAGGAKRVAGWLSPVPGGVGPVTVAMLLANVVAAAERRLRRPR